MRVWKPVVLAVMVGLAVPAASAAATLNVAPGAPDDAGTTSGCSAQSGGSLTCVTLRDAIAFANAGLAGANPTVQLAAGTYTLANTQLIPTVPMTITGTGNTGAHPSTIRQTGPAIVIGAPTSLTVKNLVVTGANPLGTNATLAGPASLSGGALSEGTGSLVLNGVTVAGNRVTGGAGVAQDTTTQYGSGGLVLGVAITSSGPLSITNSIISQNIGVGGPGGSSNSANTAGPGGAVAGAVFAGSSLTLSGSTVSNNSAIGGAGGPSTGIGSGAGGGGNAVAGITAFGAVSIAGSTISGNSASGGAGGAASGASEIAGGGGTGAGAVNFAPGAAGETLAVTNTTINGNTASGGAGGTATGTNSAGGHGGPAAGAAALLQGSGASGQAASITASTISNNTSSAGAAGAGTGSPGIGGGGGAADGAIVDSESGSGIPLSISASTISANQAASSAGGAGGTAGTAAYASGGALRVVGGATATIVNSTVFGNSVQSAGGVAFAGLAGSYGGGISVTGAGTTVGLYNDTIARNSASSALGGQWVFGPDLNAFGSGAFSLADTAVVSPFPSNVAACGSEGGTYTDLGYNLQDSASSACGLGGAGKHDQFVTNSGLPKALGANGGPTLTLAPKLGSAMIGNGGACTNPLATPATSPLTVDQRGLPRGATCDIGAFQTQPMTVAGKPRLTGTPAVGRTLTCAGATFVARGDGVYTVTGSIGAQRRTTSIASNGTRVSQSNTYKVRGQDQGHSITCTMAAAGAYGQARATSAAVRVPIVVKLSSVSQARSTWAEKKTPHGLPVGTTFRYALNTRATVTLTIARQTTRHTVARLTGPGKSGKHAVLFKGRVGRHSLAPGHYSVIITARTATSTSVKTLRFTIV